MPGRIVEQPVGWLCDDDVIHKLEKQLRPQCSEWHRAVGAHEMFHHTTMLRLVVNALSEICAVYFLGQATVRASRNGATTRRDATTELNQPERRSTKTPPPPLEEKENWFSRAGFCFFSLCCCFTSFFFILENIATATSRANLGSSSATELVLFRK